MTRKVDNRFTLSLMPFHQQRRRKESSFTLIELIGVLAVIAILAAAITPLLIARLKQAARESEKENLNQIAEGLLLYIKQNHQIPGPQNWAQAAASMIGWTAEKILTNEHRQPRVFWIDPSFQVGPSTNATLASQLPYTQGPAGSSKPQNPRILLISSMGRPLPSSIHSGVAPSEQAFQEVWNLPENTVPSSWNWNGQGEDLIVRRIHLLPLFHQVTLNVFGANQPFYSIDGGDLQKITSSPWSAWFIEGTLLSLYNQETNCVIKEVIHQNTSFSFVGNDWNSGLYFPPVPTWMGGEQLQAMADEFLMAPLNPRTLFNTTPYDVYEAMKDYLLKYEDWANSGFSMGQKFQAVRAAQRELRMRSLALILFAGFEPPEGWQPWGGPKWRHPWDSDSNNGGNNGGNQSGNSGGGNNQPWFQFHFP